VIRCEEVIHLYQLEGRAFYLEVTTEESFAFYREPLEGAIIGRYPASPLMLYLILNYSLSNLAYRCNSLMLIGLD
jgi:hypothetical protein